MSELNDWARGQPGRQQHYGVIVYRRRRQDWWRKTFWLSCWECTCSHGPYRTHVAARRAMRLWELYPTCPREEGPQ